MGLELRTPVGNRVGHVAARNAELALSRELAIYREQERQVARELSRALAELDRSYAVTRANYNRSQAAQVQLEAVRTKYDVGEMLLEFVFDAQRRATEASSIYYRSMVDYSLAVMNVHQARGTLLDYFNVQLTEGPWSAEAHASAAKQARRFKRRSINYCCTSPAAISQGAH
jgi:hypothetical protein